MGDRDRCCVCGNVKGGWSSVRAGGFVCHACYRREFAPKERCGVCGEVKYVNARPEGVPHCEACYKRVLNVAPCFYCRVTLTVHARDARRRPVCLTCYERHLARREPCSFCGLLEPPSYRGESGEPICRACWHREIHQAPCAGCGRITHVATRDGRDQPLCGHCAFARRPNEPCPTCGEARPLIDCEDGTRVCEPCWRKHKAPKVPCAGCGKVARVATWATPTKPLCHGCWARARRIQTPS